MEILEPFESRFDGSSLVPMLPVEADGSGILDESSIVSVEYQDCAPAWTGELDVFCSGSTELSC